MTQDDIILIADASGLSYYGMGKDRDRFLHHVETFADLVASAEREACAKLCEDNGLFQTCKAIRERSQT